jgi:glycyl-tRNA synthetase beta chain
MMETRPLLIEIGTEELPPKALRGLSQAFANAMRAELARHELAFEDLQPFATPRRLALRVGALAVRQPERVIERRGPSLTAAFDAAGHFTPAALGFARSCGVSAEALERIETPKGAWLVHTVSQPGRPTAEILPGAVAAALAELPIPKRMRWGSSDAEFARPVHWAVLLFGADVVPGRILGCDAGRATRGHRFLAPHPIELEDAGRYAEELRERGRVIADFEARKRTIETLVNAEAGRLGARALIDPDLLDEVTALVEWPVALTGSFDEEFLSLPREVLVASMEVHQKYFPLVGRNDELLARFVTVANIESLHPPTVIDGNQRVIRPRLKDAAFFFAQDAKQTLESRLPGLEHMVFEKRLGSLKDKTLRVAALAKHIAARTGAQPAIAERAALLSRCDLLTGMVGEFPELQGTMGRYYAESDGEPFEVAGALGEFYLPRFAGDALPATPAGRAVAVADRLDTLVGIFGVGHGPSGDKDPYALRRHALALLRICIEARLELDLRELIDLAAAAYGDRVQRSAVDPLFPFIIERLRAYYLDQGIGHDTFEAVRAREPGSPLDFDRRVRAVTRFRALPEAEALAVANKRAGNLLRRAELRDGTRVDRALLVETAEQRLAEDLADAARMVDPLIESGDYTAALTRLAGLRRAVDEFFDSVLVMCEDRALQENRLTLLANLHALFTRVADISRLQT